MSLLDFDDDPLVYLYRQKSLSANALGMPSSDPVGGAPIMGRISGISSQQQLAYGVQGFSADAELFTVQGDIENGDTVTDDAGIGYLVVGRARRIAKGHIEQYYKYPIKSQGLR